MTIKTIPDLFRRCRGRETGHWRVGDEFTRTVHIDSGDIVFASSNFPTDKLSTIMVEHGKLTKEQMEYALANLRSGMSIGKNLIEMGYITQRDLIEVARLQVEQIVRSALVATESPVFDNKDELDESIVRLPLNTPSLLFAGVMGVTDHEGLLELLGPLNQVVLLQGKRIYDDLDLPADLLKMARLMDGTHTILELSSETGIEPRRTSAFALFLREIGWGKLFELPPIDKKAITKALDTPDPTKPPSNIQSPQKKKLMEDIDDAGKPTVRLDTIKFDKDLAALIDNIGNIGEEEEPETPQEEDVPEPIPEKIEEPLPKEEIKKSVGKVIPFSSSTIEEPLELEPSIKIGQEDSYEDDYEDSGPPVTDEVADTESGKWSFVIIIRTLVLVVVGATIAWALYQLWLLKTSPRDPNQSWGGGKFPLEIQETNTDGRATDTLQQGQPTLGNDPSSQPPKPIAPPTSPQTPDTTQPIPEQSTVNISKDARYRAIADGDVALALKQGKAFRANLPKTNWTIVLVVACQQETLQNYAQILGSSRPDFFLTPYRIRNGGDCYRLFAGNYKNKNVVDAEVRSLLNIIKDQSMRPKAIQISDITEVQ
ncbi:MAG: hypothetical protein FWG02_00695 [Holophagaceae bacterium]|nr:hypothetical protein [Holophagaceae bacterium]